NVQYKPSVEAIQEFKLQNNSFSAEYGNNGGTVVSIVTKSGTNQFHGSGWWFFRRPSLDGNDFFSNAAGQPIRPVCSRSVRRIGRRTHQEKQDLLFLRL